MSLSRDCSVATRAHTNASGQQNKQQHNATCDADGVHDISRADEVGQLHLQRVKVVSGGEAGAPLGRALKPRARHERRRLVAFQDARAAIRALVVGHALEHNDLLFGFLGCC